MREKEWFFVPVGFYIHRSISYKCTEEAVQAVVSLDPWPQVRHFCKALNTAEPHALDSSRTLSEHLFPGLQMRREHKVRP